MARLKFDIIPSQEIDAGKWNNCIINCEANRIYANHNYLQHLADNWSGLVMNDYAAVMPIVWRKKWGIRYVYDAPFIQQLGLFGTYDSDDLKQAIDTTMGYIQYGDLYFNNTNPVPPILPSAKAATNLIIPLHIGYDIIRQGYNDHLKTKLRKASGQQLQYAISDNIKLAVNTYQQLYANRFPSVTPVHYQRLKAIAKQLFNSQQCFIRSVLDKENKLLAVALFFKDENRIYNMLPSTTEQGRKASAMHFLIDNVILEFASKSLTLDFEGSNVPGIKSFYQSFGAVNEPYYYLHYNHLPKPFRWLKR